MTIDSKTLENKLRDAGQAAVHLVAAGAEAKSKIGGLPNARVDFPWPHWNDKPLGFIAQLDLQELAAFASITDLPTAGSLYFFYDQEQSTWGFDPKDRGSWRVVYSEDALPRSEVPAPSGLSPDSMYEPVPVAPRPIRSYPSSERLELDLRGASADIFDVEFQLRHEALGEAPGHQVAGYPIPVQGDGMGLECQLASNGLFCGDATGYTDPRAADLAPGAKEWKLLFQLDTDDQAEMMWGDCGTLYFWIRRSDLVRKDFSQVWMVLQCG